MHPLVRDLYKRFLWVGKDYPKGLAYVREHAKKAIQGNSNIKSDEELMKAVHKGRFWVNELIGVVKLRKYRTLRKRYGDVVQGIDEVSALEIEAMNDAMGTANSSKDTAALGAKQEEHLK